MITTEYESPIGTLTLAADESGLRHLVFPSGSRAYDAPAEWIVSATGFDQVRKELDAYFAGTLQKFSIEISPHGTLFQQNVWKALVDISYATTCTYRDIADAIGKPTASRAVGAANGANPIPIIVPCHRVIGSSGKLTGFGGGILTKQWLLAHEQGIGQLFAFTSQEADQTNLA